MGKRRWAWSGAVVLGLALAIPFLVVRDRVRHRVAPTDVEPRSFDARGWESGSATLRHGMARQLVASGELIGTSRDDIIGRLGPPLDGATAGQLEWFLGPRRSGSSMMWDYQGYLVVLLDGEGRCREASMFNRD